MKILVPVDGSQAALRAVKHAAAEHCRVTLRATRNDRVELIVEDDGRGFTTVPSGPNGLGLVGMRERAAAMQGTFEVQSAPGEGTRLTITLPIATT